MPTALILLATIYSLLISIYALEIYFLIGLLLFLGLWIVKLSPLLGNYFQPLLAANWLRFYARIKDKLYREFSTDTSYFSPISEDQPAPAEEVITDLSYIRHFWKLQILSWVIILGSVAAIFLPQPQVLSPRPPLFAPLEITSRRPLTIEFDRPINPNSLLATLSPSVPGQWTLTSRKYLNLFIDTLNFYPAEKLTLETEYTVNLEDIQPPLPWNHSRDYLFIFTTPTDKSKLSSVNSTSTEEPPLPQPTGETAIFPVSVTPVDQAVDVNVGDPIVIVFNQSVDPASADANFLLQPAATGIFRWVSSQASEQPDTLTFWPDPPLAYNTRYQLTLNPAIRSMSGHFSDRSYQYTFTTNPLMFSLDLPLRKQHYKFTCFATAAQMVMAYYGVEQDELSIWQQLPHDTTERNFITNTWGNPNKGIVGTIDGVGPGGYGVHWEPVAAMLARYRQVEVKRQWHIPGLLAEVRAGHPVMVWWVNGVWPAKDVSWHTPQDGKIYTVNGMHVEVVKGWIGDQNHPEYILTNDPWRGDRRYSPDKFLNLWKWFENTGVIVK